MLSCLRWVVFLKNDVFFFVSPGLGCYPASGGSFFWKMTSFLFKSWSPVVSCLRRVVLLKNDVFLPAQPVLVLARANASRPARPPVEGLGSALFASRAGGWARQCTFREPGHRPGSAAHFSRAGPAAGLGSALFVGRAGGRAQQRTFRGSGRRLPSGSSDVTRPFRWFSNRLA